MEFEKRIAQLNEAQQEAVQTIEGPLLVIAGPGTGKTELLSMRVANILRATDTLPQNILCLTFTESATENMRQRLSRYIGTDAYDVNISTYHAFGGELIRRFPEYFSETRLQNPVDELGKREIIADIVEKMSYLNPLKQTKYHLGDLISTISELKRGLLDSESLRTVARENTLFINEANPLITAALRDMVRMPGKANQVLALFEPILESLQVIKAQHSIKQYLSLQDIVVSELTTAIEEVKETNKSSPLTKWKNAWLAKNSDNEFILGGELQNRRLIALADVLDTYQQALEARGLYDFDDMILRSIGALNKNKDFKYSLQEQYQYILLDEFQDTNAAQFELVRLLTDNPVNEGRPNVLAVGDDDQAIYAFQGAHYSNMVDFYQAYRDTKVLYLLKNYRSHPDVLHVAHNIAEQIESRLHHHFENMSKVLEAAGDSISKSAQIERHEFMSDISEAQWIAKDIARKIKDGTSPSEIAVLAPRHKYLEPLVAYLHKENISVHYEKREDILQTPTIQSLKTMANLCIALTEGNEKLANALWPIVLSYEFFNVPVSEIWQGNWQVANRDSSSVWTKYALEHPALRPTGVLFLAIAAKAKTESAELILDYLIGTQAVETNEPEMPSAQSPMREYYLGTDAQHETPGKLYDILSHLTVIRSKLCEYQNAESKMLTIEDFLHFIDLYEASETRMINTSPYHQSRDAVQLMTVFKAKGLEFEHVYLPACVDEVWGESSRGNTNKLTLPTNLAPIRHAGANQDERLRIFFVAITRAKCGLYLTSPAQNYAGKITKRLKYLDEQTQDGEIFVSRVLPETSITKSNAEELAPPLVTLEHNWAMKHLEFQSNTSLRDLLQERLDRYQISPTHLNNFTDIVFCGPQAFFFASILRFPSAPSVGGQFGNAIHETLQWYQLEINAGKRPSIAQVQKYFEKRMLGKFLPEEETKLLLERGNAALKCYLEQRAAIFVPNNAVEHNFRNEGVLLGDVHMTGKVDLLEVNREDKTICVVDYKTGKAHDKWASDVRLHNYKHQLYCYKLLIEGSHTFRGYSVLGGRLEFIEPEDGQIKTLHLDFNDKDLEHTKALLKAVWKKIKDLDMPDISKYPPNMTGIRAFEQDLLT
jgi:DNA helicase II / ATP-dependent DNA helicase PcrA